MVESLGSWRTLSRGRGGTLAQRDRRL